jgi:hypothetical protein
MTMATNPENETQKNHVAGANAQSGGGQRKTTQNQSPGERSSAASGNGPQHDAATRERGERQGILSGIHQSVSSKADSQKNRAAEGIAGIADAIRNASNELRSQNESLASLVDGASDQLKSFADSIRQRGTGEIVRDIADFGRRQPAMFLGGAFLIGLGAARFLKSSSQDISGDESSFERFGTDPMTASPRSQTAAGSYGEAFDR